MIITIDALTYILRVLINKLGPHPRLDLVESRRKFLKHLRARNAEAAVAEMTDHLTKLHQHLVREQHRIDRSRLQKSTRFRSSRPATCANRLGAQQALQRDGRSASACAVTRPAVRSICERR